MFTNLIETDQVYGHRHDVAGFHRALREIDAAVARLARAARRADDLLVLTADHGCDVTMPHTDHTREHVPLLAVFAGHGGRRHDGPLADVGASALAWLADGARPPSLPGESFVVPEDRRRMPELPEVETIRRQLAPHLEGRTIEVAEILDARWTRPDPPEPVAGRADRGARRAGRPRGQVPRLVAVGRSVSARASADDRRAPVRPACSSRPTRACGSSSTEATGWSTSIRAGSGPGISARRRGPRRSIWPSGSGSSRSRRQFTDRVPAPGRPRAGARRSRRSCSTSAGSPASATSTPTRRCSGRGIHPLRPAGRLTAAQWARLRDAIEEALQRRDRRQGRLDRRLPPRRRRPRLLPGPLPRPPRAGEPCPTAGGRSARSSSAAAERTCASTASHARGSADTSVGRCAPVPARNAAG